MTLPERTAAPLIINLFGPMQLLVDGQPFPRLRSRKGIWLLALLTLRQGQPVEREWLAGTLWPDMDQNQAFANLRPILSELRNGLGPQKDRLQSPDRHTLLLNLVGAEVDVSAFDAAIKRGKQSDLEQAVTLYRGPLLEGCPEEWVFQERTVREHQCLQALQTLGNAALHAGEYSQAIGHYHRAAALDPLEDSVRRGWMEALAKSGDRNSAMQVYREFMAVLRDDPGASPDEQTTALYMRLRAEARGRNSSQALIVTKQPPVVPKVAGHLPHPLTDLIGREDERLEVSARLYRSRLVTLTGMGGIGKTRLALEVAREVAEQYADGVWLVALDALSEGKQVTLQIAAILGIKEESGRSPLESVTQHLLSRQALLVLDNCEHLLDTSAQVVAHLLQECQKLRILATSREALEIAGETVWMVPSLATPDPAHLPQGQATLLRVLMSYESIQLFVERAQAVHKTFALTGSNARAVAQVCFRLEGIPLAIELAAARIKAMAVEQIAARLDNELSLLTGGSRAALPRQQTLRTMLDWSYKLLTEQERGLLQRLSVFAGGWTLDAAEHVGIGAGIVRGQIPSLLTLLIDKSLVAFEERENRARYRLLDMVRQYGAEKLRASGETETIRSQHRDYFLMLAEEGEKQLQGPAQGEWLARFDIEHENLQGALAWCSLDPVGADTGLRLAAALWRFWDIRGHYSEGRAYLTAALQREKTAEMSAVRAKALNGAGVFASAQGDFAEARELHEASLAISRKLGDKRGSALPLHHLGIMASRQGNYPLARALNEEGLALWQELEDKWGMAHSLHQLGGVARELSDFVSARNIYTQCLAISRELGDKQGIAWSLNDMGEVAYQQGDYAAACEFYEESLTISQELGDRQSIAWSLHHLASALSEQGELTRARILCEESLAIFRELGNRQGLAWALRQQGHLASVQGDHNAANIYCEESLLLQRQLQNRVGIAWALYSLGRVAYAQGDFAIARSLYRESITLHAAIEKLKGVAECLDGLADVALVQADARLAVSLWGASAAVQAQTGTPKAPSARREYESGVRQARILLGETFTAVWEEGYTLRLEEAIARGLTDSVPKSQNL